MKDHYSAAILESALTGQLPQDEEQRLHQHLEQCPQCSEALEQMAGGPTWCREAAALLTEDALDADVPTHEHWSEIDFTVEHLEPADEPNVLGRLGGYDVLEVIGRGGMGVVLKALDRDLKRLVAIKVLAPHLAQSPLAKKRFAREAQAAAAVVHSNVLAIHQVQPLGRLPFLVMPLVAGESLAERLAAQGTLELKEILRISMQAAAGLAAAHEQGLVHRDVKPANILLEHGIERAVLTDFGLARAADDVTLTRWGIVAGTPQYMSPEQARGEPLDGRSDLFSLGCVLYEMATGISPFRADSMLATMRRLVDEAPQSMDSLNPELPPWFVAIVEKLLEKDPARRFSSAAEVSQLLERCLAHLQQPTNVPLPEGLPADTVTKRTNHGSWFRWKPIRWIGGIVALLLVTIGAVGAFMFATGDPPDIAGDWTGKDWGSVVLKQSDGGEITGTYTDVFGNEPGKIEMKWSRIERRFNGTWSEGKDRYGKISIRLLDNDIRGGWTTNRKAKINGGTPELADLLWVRPKSNAAAKDDARKSRDSDKETTGVNWTFGPVKNLMMFTTSSNLSSDALRLSDGHLFNLPKKGADKKGNDGAPTRDELEKWFAETGVNVAIDYHKPSDQWELKLRNVRFAQLLDDWQALAAKEFQSRFVSSNASLKWSSPENRDADLKETGFYSLKFSRGITPPMTFAFETDDGQRGIFQFMATNMTSAGVNAIIRLKRLQQQEVSNNAANTEAPATAARDRAEKHNDQLSFGPVIERTMNGISQANNVLKLETGELLTAPGDLSNYSTVAEWAKANGADIVSQGGRMAITLVGGLASLGHWDATAQEVADSIRNIEEKLKSQNDPNSDFSKTGSAMIVEPNGWNTYYIKSRNGVIGVFQLKKSNEGPRSTTIRYKLVKDASRSDQVSNGTESRNGKPIFSPVIERALNDISIGSSNSALNLTTGERLSPDAREFENAKTWAEANGADIIACSDGGGRGLRIIGGVAVKPADWYASPTEVSEVVANMERGIEKYKRDIPGFQDPRLMGFSNLWFAGTEESSTYYVKTKNGTLGVLQINRLKDYPRSVEFRYKLLGVPNSKRQRFVPVEGRAKETHWAFLLPPSVYSKTDLAVQASMTLGGEAQFESLVDRPPLFTFKLLKGNDDAITLEVQDAAGKLKTTVSIARDQPAEVTVDGVGYKFYYPTVNVALKDPDASPFANVIVNRVELPRENAANDEHSHPDSPVAHFVPKRDAELSWSAYQLECTLSKPRHVILGVVQFIDEQHSVSIEIPQLDFYFATADQTADAQAQLKWQLDDIKEGEGAWNVRMKGECESKAVFDRNVRLAGKVPFLALYGTPDNPDHGPDLGLDPKTISWEAVHPERPFWIDAGDWKEKKWTWNTLKLFEARDREKRIVATIQLKLIACPMYPDIQTHWSKPMLKNGDWENDKELLNEIGRPVEKASLDFPATPGESKANENTKPAAAANEPAANRSAAAPRQMRRTETDIGVHHIACSADGKQIAITNGNPTFVMQANGVGRPKDGWQPVVEILDAESGKVIARLELTTAEEDAVLAGTERVNHFEVTALAFSPDGNTLAVGTDIGQIKLYDAKDGKFLSSLDDSQGKAADARTPENWKTIPRALGNVASIAISPDGNLLAACGQSFDDVSDRFRGLDRMGYKSTGPGRLKVWDLETGTLKHDLAGHSHVQAVAFSSDGKLLASAGEWMTGSNHGAGVIIWDSQTGKKTLTSSTDANCGAHSVCFSPTRKQIAWSVVRYDKENATYATSVSLTYPLSGISDWQKTIPGWAFPKAFLPDGKSVAVQHGNAIEIVDTESGATKHELKPLGDNAGEHWNDFAIAPAGTIFIGGSGADKMRGFLDSWDLAPGGNQTKK